MFFYFLSFLSLYSFFNFYFILLFKDLTTCRYLIGTQIQILGGILYSNSERICHGHLYHDCLIMIKWFSQMVACCILGANQDCPISIRRQKRPKPFYFVFMFSLLFLGLTDWACIRFFFAPLAWWLYHYLFSFIYFFDEYVSRF